MASVDTILRVELMVTRGLKVIDIARKLRVSRVALSRVLNGQSVLSIKLALNIERAFGFDARKLLIAQLDDQIEAQRELENENRNPRRPA